MQKTVLGSFGFHIKRRIAERDENGNAWSFVFCFLALKYSPLGLQQNAADSEKKKKIIEFQGGNKFLLLGGICVFTGIFGVKLYHYFFV